MHPIPGANVLKRPLLLQEHPHILAEVDADIEAL
jgi:hypothetical protein